MHNEEYYFESWTPLELFFYLIDVKEIPYYSRFENWKYLKDDMIRMCKEYKNDTRSTEN